MGSSRLPGKVMLPLAGHEMLYHIIERLKRVPSLDHIVVATMAGESDEPIVEYCRRNDYEVFAYQGDEDDLLGRYIACGDQYAADVIVMVCGDCPLFDPVGVESRVQLLRQKPDIESADFDAPTIEGGVAVLRLATYKKIAGLVADAAHREHATLYLMEHPSLFNTDVVTTDPAYRDIKHRLWLDTPADYAFLREVYRRLYRAGEVIDLHDVVAQLKADQGLCALNAHVTQKQVRPQGCSICLEVTDLDVMAMDSAIALAHSMIERHNMGVRLFTVDLNDEAIGLWQAQQIHVTDQPPRPSEALVYLHAGEDGFVPLKPGEGGEPRVRIGLADQHKLAMNTDLLAAYLGQQSGDEGHFVATLRSSDDGSHLCSSDCPLCGGTEHSRVWQHDSGVASVMCDACGHVFLGTRPAPETIKAGYGDFKQHYDEAYLLDPEGPVAGLANTRYQYVSSLVEGHVENVLELGCGYGHFLSQFDRTALRVGIEPSAEQARFARKHFALSELWQCGYEAFSQSPKRWPETGFDLICSFHVLEHVEQPRDFIRFVKSHLQPDGRLCLAVPNLLTLSPDLIELFFLVRGLHLHAFSPVMLENLLLSEGFEIIDIREEPEIPMLRSSMVVTARLSEKGVINTKPVDTQGNFAAARRFHLVLDAKLEKLRMKLSSWKDRADLVFIYGGGVHTRALLELAATDCTCVAGIIDDDPAKQGSSITGIDIVDFDTAREMGMSVVLVSSLASETKILRRLEGVLQGAVSVVGIYRDIFN